MKKTALIFALLTIGIACETSNQSPENDFKGFYKIHTIESSLPIDLNNDGIKSNDYLSEIQSDYTLHTGEIVNYNYNPNNEWNFASASPLPLQQNETKFLNINFPAQSIDSVFMGNDTYEKINMEYRKLNTSFLYEIQNQNVSIASDPFDQFTFLGITNFDLQRINKNQFFVAFNFNVYDFIENQWVNTRLTASYTQIDLEE